MIARWPAGPVCRSCYRRARANPAACSTCGQIRVLVATTVAGEPGRASVGCVRQAHTPIFASNVRAVRSLTAAGIVCGAKPSTGSPAPFADVDGQLTGDASAIVDAFMASRRARSVLEWLPAAAVEPRRDVTHDAVVTPLSPAAVCYSHAAARAPTMSAGPIGTCVARPDLGP